MRIASAITLITIIAALACGCGYKTNPRPATASVPGEVGLVSANAYPQKVVLTWDTPSANVDGSPIKDLSGFKVYRSTQKVGEECDNCEYTENMYANVDIEHPVSAVIDRGEVVYTDTGVKPGSVYHYSVTAYNYQGHESPRSQTVTVVFDDLPPAPTGVRISSDARGIVLKWDEPAERGDIKSFRIYRGETSRPDDMKPVGHTQWTETYFVDRDPEKGKTYFYTVRSIKLNRGTSLESEPSEVVRETVQETGLRLEQKTDTIAGLEGVRLYGRGPGSQSGAGPILGCRPLQCHFHDSLWLLGYRGPCDMRILANTKVQIRL